MWETEATKPADLTAPHRLPSVAEKYMCGNLRHREGQERKMEDTFLARGHL